MTHQEKIYPVQTCARVEFCNNQGFELAFMDEFLTKELGYDSFADFQHCAGSFLLFSIHPDDIAAFQAFVKTPACQKDWTGRLRCKDGTFAYYRMTNQQLREDGERQLVVCECVQMKDTAPAAQSVQCANTTDESIFLKLADDIPLGILRCRYERSTRALHTLFCNPPLCAITGYPIAQWQRADMDWMKSIVYSQDRACIAQAMGRLLGDADTTHCEFRIVRGEELAWMQMTVRVTERCEDGLTAEAAFLDISQIKRAEQALYLQNYCLERLNESLFFGMIVKEVGLDQRPLYASENIKQLLRRLFPEEDQPFSYEDIIHPADCAYIQDIAQWCREELPDKYEIEFRLHMGDGTYLWVKGIGKRLSDFSKSAYLLVFVDISNLKEAEIKLRIREEEYRIAVTHSKDILMRLNIQDGTIYIPDEIAKRHNIPDKMENMPYYLVDNGCIQPESVADYLEFYEKIMRGENCSVEVKSKGFGRYWWFLGIATVIFNEKNEPVSKQAFSRITHAHRSRQLITEQYIAEESIAQARAFFQRLRYGTPRDTTHFKVRLPDGGWAWYHCTYATVFAEDHTPLYAIIFCEDVTNKRQSELASMRFQNYTRQGTKEILFNLEYNLTLDTFEGYEGQIPERYFKDFTTSYTKATERMCQDILLKYREMFMECFSRENLLEGFEKNQSYGTKEFQIAYHDGETIWIRAFYQILKDPYTSSINVWISCLDINEEKRSEIRLLEMARLDLVTGAYNRTAFIDYVTERCSSPEGGLNRAMILLDVDGFRKVNHTLGHVYGDTALKGIAQTLKVVVDKEDMVARIGEDEFAIYVNDVSDITMAKEHFRIMIAAVYRELQQGVKVSISAGVALFPRDGKDFQTLYEKADRALYQAKVTGRNKYVIYDESMQEIAERSVITPIEQPIFVNDGVYIRTFGYFGVFVNGEALLIHNAKAKELLALLVDRRGAYVSQGDIISCLWEDESVNKVTLARVRKIVMILRNTLKEYHLEDLIESKKGMRRLNTTKVRCDLYNYLSRKPEYAHLFKGAYWSIIVGES